MHTAILLFIFVTLVSAAPKARLNLRNIGIVGGESINITDAPHQVSVRYFGSHLCGGSILNEEYVVTAGHCSHGATPPELSVQAGSAILNDPDIKPIFVEEISVHPDFDCGKQDFDVTVLKLSEKLVYSERIQPIKLPEINDYPELGSVVFTSGWGATNENASYFADNLQLVDVVMIDHLECKVDYEGVHEITERMICAGLHEGGRDSCDGDSGGPLIQNGILYGLTSWGLGCARSDYPGIYTAVSHPAVRNHINVVTNL